MLGLGVSLMECAIRPTGHEAAPVLSLISGSGHAGSVYGSSLAGQWFADDIALPGETGQSWVMDIAHEGAAIRCMGSNSITAPTPLTKPSLVAYWDFSEAQAPFCSRRGSLAADVGLTTLSGPDVTFGPGGPHGRCALFGGSTLLGIPAGSVGALDVAAQQAVTLVAWINRSTNEQHAIAGRWREDSADPSRQYGLFVNLPAYDGSQRVCGHVSSSGGPSPGFAYSIDYSASSRRLFQGRWHMVAFTFDGAEAISYLDGIADRREDYTASSGGSSVTKRKNPYPYPEGLNPASTSAFTVGGVRLTGQWGNLFSGGLGALAVFNAALTAAEIMTLWRSRGGGSHILVNEFDRLVDSGVTAIRNAGLKAWRGAGAADISGNSALIQATRAISGGHDMSFAAFIGSLSQPDLALMPFANPGAISAVSVKVHVPPGTVVSGRLIVSVEGALFASAQLFSGGAGGAATDWSNAVTWAASVSGAWLPVTVIPDLSLAIGSVEQALPAGGIDGIGLLSLSRTGNLRFRDMAIDLDL